MKGELISLFNPIPQNQFSAELEQLRVNINEIGSNTTQRLLEYSIIRRTGYRNERNSRR
jgi:hypothetical protein